jgi:hypothetical protein
MNDKVLFKIILSDKLKVPGWHCGIFFTKLYKELKNDMSSMHNFKKQYSEDDRGIIR